MNNDKIIQIVKTMASQPDVMNAVIKSHDDNPWWPMSITDWRMRMIVAGLSTRVSFRMLHIYKNVIAEFSKLTYEDVEEETGKIRSGRQAQKACERLLKRVMDRDEKDNISCILICVHSVMEN